jgi:pyridoxal phosphate enzyme (YggS family)
MIAQNIQEIQKTIPQNVTLVAVSKTKPIALLMEAYKAGIRVFGENKALELRDKAEVLPKDIRWHFIGHLQSNKVKYIAPYVELIHSVDSLKILSEINKRAALLNRNIDCLLEFHIAEEESKYGLDLHRAKAILESAEYSDMKNIRIRGVMGMASYTTDKEQIRREFSTLSGIYTEIKTQYFSNEEYFTEISMGMSGDYLLAIEQGSTMVRIGSRIFGKR